MGVLNPPPEVLLIDDGSPQTKAVDIVRQTGCRIPIRVFRIKEDIPWNFTGARNLGCFNADGWIYISDIDTLLFPQDAKKLFEATALVKDYYYMPKRVIMSDLREIRPSTTNILYHKEKFLEIGGYDEDYAGHYGRGDTDFIMRLNRSTQCHYCEEVTIRAVLSTQIRDAATKHRSRDKMPNLKLYEKKSSAGFIKPKNPLRFLWERVL